MHLENDQTERKIAAKLFGEQNLKGNNIKLTASAPLVIHCKDRKSEAFLGDYIDGFSSRFCNGFYPSPTDVGMCHTKNLDIKDLYSLDENYAIYMEEANQASMESSKGNRDGESTYILLTDVFTLLK